MFVQKAASLPAGGLIPTLPVHNGIRVPVFSPFYNCRLNVKAYPMRLEVKAACDETRRAS